MNTRVLAMNHLTRWKNLAARPAWVTNITFAFQWSAANPALLDALPQIHPPARTLIHQSDWRTSQYDADYPDYQPSAAGQKFMDKANAMGFRVMPHFNFFACSSRTGGSSSVIGRAGCVWRSRAAVRSAKRASMARSLNLMSTARCVCPGISGRAAS